MDLHPIPRTLEATEDTQRCTLGYVSISKGQAVALVTTYPHESAQVLAGWIVPYSTARDLFVVARELRNHCARNGWRTWEDKDALEAIERIIAQDLANDLIEAASQ